MAKSAKSPTRKNLVRAKQSRKKSSPVHHEKPVRPGKEGNIVLYVDSSFFFPGDSEHGYLDDFQGGRYTRKAGNLLQAPILLPVDAKIKTITIYYMNTSSETMMVTYLKKHIDHHAFSGEVEVSFESLPPGTLAPDNYLAKLINHFENAGVIKDKYLYFLQVQNTGKPDDKIIKTVRGMRIEYEP